MSSRQKGGGAPLSREPAQRPHLTSRPAVPLLVVGKVLVIGQGWELHLGVRAKCRKGAGEKGLQVTHTSPGHRCSVQRRHIEGADTADADT